jgi:hypothetical protein
MKRRVLCAIALAYLLTSNPGQAATVINTDSSVVATTSGVSTSATTGADMTGMNVTAFFSDGSSKSAIWATTGVEIGGAAISGVFSLSETGNTFGGPWDLTNSYSATLTKLTIDGGAGSTVFDIDDLNEGTVGSGVGEAYTDRSFPPGTIVATYSKIVALSGSAPVGDLFAILTIDYTGLDGGGIASGSGLSFAQDTDNLALLGDLQTTPLPAALPLFAGGLGVIGLLARRRKQKFAMH